MEEEGSVLFVHVALQADSALHRAGSQSVGDTKMQAGIVFFLAAGMRKLAFPKRVLVVCGKIDFTFFVSFALISTRLALCAASRELKALFDQ